MLGLFVAIGIAILALLMILIWFVPHLLEQHALRVASESAQLREMLLDMMNEQEAVAMRQAELGTSVSYLQDQLEQIIAANTYREHNESPSVSPPNSTEVRELEDRLHHLQAGIDRYMCIDCARTKQDNESWAYLLSLLTTIQDRIRVLSMEESNSIVETHSSNSHDRYHR